MVWSKDLPDGTKALNLGDNDIRANFTALEDALDLIHYFATGGSQTGLDKSMSGSTSTRNSTITSPALGNHWLNTSNLSSHGFLVLQRYDGADWIDVGPYSLVPYLADANVWTGANVETYTALTEAGGGPGNTWDWVLNTSTAWKGTLDDDTILNNPTGSLIAADRRCSVVVQVTQDAAVARTLTFGTNLLPAWGGQPAVNQTLSAITFIHMTLRSDQKWIYSVEYTT